VLMDKVTVVVLPLAHVIVPPVAKKVGGTGFDEPPVLPLQPPNVSATVVLVSEVHLICSPERAERQPTEQP
jgi:hypothetical protein